MANVTLSWRILLNVIPSSRLFLTKPLLRSTKGRLKESIDQYSLQIGHRTSYHVPVTQAHSYRDGIFDPKTENTLKRKNACTPIFG